MDNKTTDNNTPVMRVEIKTKTPVRDNDIKALYLLQKAMEISSSERMKQVNIDFIKSKHKLK